DCGACHCIDHATDRLVIGQPPYATGRNDETVGAIDATAAQPCEVEQRPELVAISMIAAPRTVATTDPSLPSLRRGGFAQTIDVFAEPGAEIVKATGVVIHENAARLGPWRNWRQAAQWLLENTTAPYLLICEDDIELAEDAALGLQHAIDSLPR